MTTDQRREEVRTLLARRTEKANVFPSFDEAVRRITDESKLTFYLGIDPTGPQVHLGHTIPLLLLADLAKLGHTATILIGDFTARVGDPTSRAAVRVALSEEEVQANMATYLEQVQKIIPADACTIEYNSTWLAALNLGDVIKLAGHVTVQQMLARDMFQERLKNEKPIYLHEFLYPLLQGYDSVALRTDGEVGGNDQTFNMLVGRDLEKELIGKDKLVLATRLLVDVATGKKMSKTEGTLIALDDSPQEIRRKVLALDDSMIATVFELCTNKDQDWIAEQANDPRALKEALAEELIRMYHGAGAVGEATKPVEVPVDTLVKVVIASEAAKTATAAKSLITQGAVVVNGEVVKEWGHELKTGDEVHIGKGKRLKLK